MGGIFWPAKGKSAAAAASVDGDSSGGGRWNLSRRPWPMGWLVGWVAGVEAPHTGIVQQNRRAEGWMSDETDDEMRAEGDGRDPARQ